MTDRIELHRMQFSGMHGVLPDEHVMPQRFEVDVVLELDLRAAGRSDSLSDTIDYGAVFRAAEAVITGAHVDLIETLAERIAQRVLGLDSRVEVVTVRVRKPEAPLPGTFGWAGTEITRRR